MLGNFPLFNEELESAQEIRYRKKTVTVVFPVRKIMRLNKEFAFFGLITYNQTYS